jgi:ParB family chromosome partitioning protein
MQEAISRGDISSGHARAVLSIVNPPDQQVLYRRIVDAALSVRQAERVAAELNKGKRQSGKPGKSQRPARGAKGPEIREIEERLIEHLGTKVEIKCTGEKGKIEIAYYSTDDLERLSEILLK